MDSKFDDIFPRDVSDPQAAMLEFLRNIIIRPNFIPAIRYYLGWRGVKTAVEGPEAWSARIKNRQGVFGIVLQESRIDANGFVYGIVRLNYFCDPNEDIVEKFSFRAGLAAMQPDYIERVREFSSYADLNELFNIATIELSFSVSQRAYHLRLHALENFRIYSVDGLRIEANGVEQVVVEPGGIDQDLPSWDLAFEFFEVLAASVSFLVRSAPVQVLHGVEPGQLLYVHDNGEVTISSDGKGKKKFIELIWMDQSQEGLGEVRPFPDALWWHSHKAQHTASMDKQTLGIDHRPEFIILSGFLGSGKTSFLQNFIEYQQQFNRFVAVIQNEIGAKGLDASLLDKGYTMLELDEGCVCCSLVGSVHTGVQQILKEFQPDYIVLETTGAANPQNLLDELVELENDIRFDSVTVVVDALNIKESLVQYDVAAEQLRVADILILNKTETLSESERESVKEMIRFYNSWAPIVCTSFGDINPALLYGDMEESSSAMTRAKEAIHKKSHHHNHQMDGISAVTISLERGVDQEQLFEALAAVPREIFRIKGFVYLESEQTWAVLQCVGGRVNLNSYNGRVEEGYLVFIGRHTDQFDPQEWRDKMYGQPRKIRLKPGKKLDIPFVY